MIKRAMKNDPRCYHNLIDTQACPFCGWCPPALIDRTACRGGYVRPCIDYADDLDNLRLYQWCMPCLIKFADKVRANADQDTIQRQLRGCHEAMDAIAMYVFTIYRDHIPKDVSMVPLKQAMHLQQLASDALEILHGAPGLIHDRL